MRASITTAALVFVRCIASAQTQTFNKRVGLEPTLDCILTAKVVTADPAMPKSAVYPLVLHRDQAQQLYTSMDLTGFKLNDPQPYNAVDQQIMGDAVTTIFTANATALTGPPKLSYFFLQIALYYTQGKSDLQYEVEQAAAYGLLGNAG
ncbi:uncharacterized protein L969DRAFT_85335 [Mixia osmundae IAM 14324]|nr:uncharacterized protein L969DRAFT_85335 [Mixia osmundae IAM 14324]KEI41540.1 hypothetical protein L969DRAFT_85335 [Mixia osmundae IAM 14324]